MKKPHSALLAGRHIGKITLVLLGLQSLAWGTVRDTSLTECIATAPKNLTLKSNPDATQAWRLSHEGDMLRIRSLTKSEHDLRIRLIQLGAVDDEDNMLCSTDTYIQEASRFENEELHLTCLVQVSQNVDLHSIRDELAGTHSEASHVSSMEVDLVSIDSWSDLPSQMIEASRKVAAKQGGKFLGCASDAGVTL